MMSSQAREGVVGVWSDGKTFLGLHRRRPRRHRILRAPQRNADDWPTTRMVNNTAREPAALAALVRQRQAAVAIMLRQAAAAAAVVRQRQPLFRHHNCHLCQFFRCRNFFLCRFTIIMSRTSMTTTWLPRDMITRTMTGEPSSEAVQRRIDEARDHPAFTVILFAPQHELEQALTRQGEPELGYF